MEALPAYLWPPATWIEQANRLQSFVIAYPIRLPKADYYTRYLIGNGRWLSVPILHATKDTPYAATWPSDQRWRLYHWRTLVTLYGKAPFFYEWKPFLEYLYLEAQLYTLRDFADLIFQELARLYAWRYEWAPTPGAIPPFQYPAKELSILDKLLRTVP
ncbi:MAG: WbqC family protein [Bacteroidia bacterium]